MSTDARFAVLPRTRPLWLRFLLGFLAAFIIATLAIAISSLSGRNNQQTMHPDSVSPDGAGALGAILSDRGIATTVVHTASDALDAGGTILVWDPHLLLSDTDREQLLTERLIIVSESGQDTQEWLGKSLGTFAGSPDDIVPPSCGQGWLNGIDGAQGMTVGVGAAGCFPIDGGRHILIRDRVMYVASPELFINANLAQADNAAIALRALGQSDSVAWLMPATERVDQPSTVPPALTGALIGFVLVALWYGILVRRPFGPLISEQLPVVVPSAEAARGRARLYERGRATSHAGAALRAGTIARHTGRLGLPPDSTPDMVVERVSDLSGRSPHDVRHLLYGPDPATDSELAALANALTDLSKELTDE
ncbi:DUF4350 domain-containing protein [Flaviflexus huanghaiensis]|uniref:DUF4350 domain-containing protein n=1 Tax=Flaviflexus huanghaiensis TaxID=1111473 RepID=UPI0015FCDB0E|nr:DUF4350 domain-containing protein [Flaviflexus huanghaiensis]